MAHCLLKHVAVENRFAFPCKWGLFFFKSLWKLLSLFSHHDVLYLCEDLSWLSEEEFLSLVSSVEFSSFVLLIIYAPYELVVFINFIQAIYCIFVLQIIILFSKNFWELLPFHSRLFLFYECNNFRISVWLPIKKFKSPPPPPLTLHSSLFPLRSEVLCSSWSFSSVWEPKTIPGRLFSLSECWSSFILGQTFLLPVVPTAVCGASFCGCFELFCIESFTSCPASHFTFSVSLPSMPGRLMAPKSVHFLVPGTFEYTAFHSKRDFAVWLSFLTWEDYPGFSRGSWYNHRVSYER